jgi:hypothetical protein
MLTKVSAIWYDGQRKSQEVVMVPKFVSDAGYTAVGLGVLAIQQVQIRRRETRARLEAQTADARRCVEALLDQAKGAMAPVTSQLERLPRLPVPGPLGHVLEDGRDRLFQVLRAS